MNIRRKEFVSEIKRLQLELSKISHRLSELEDLANPAGFLAASVTLVPDGSVDAVDNGFAANVSVGMFKSRMNTTH